VARNLPPPGDPAAGEVEQQAALVADREHEAGRWREQPADHGR
jgi:hypothetical protein